ncbi:putative DNA polymerase III subunit beta [Streptomyces afghaniensis 772]|uniref:Putative DNA polymerase III subunit beta n=1 Tax=Streptomyces afghaniensis 772 TaxID=1283301 RepID=S4MN21_9ACTN|nr:DNA polymerase III subunit beta [Streptomyces afghaniensis]EPJ40968.1 putative DNA polymerase III subunit beta [Streptomyces afghaniensis 772]
MEFRIDRTAFAEAVGRAVRALPARTPVPVLGGLLLEADAGRLAVTGFDFEAAVRVAADAEVAVPGRVLVLGRRLLDVCRVLPDGPVSCALEASRFTVEADGTRFGLSTLPVAEYPALPVPPAPYGTVDGAAFATAVAQVAVAAGRDDTLPLLTGVQLRLDGGEMTFAASDRYRYAVRRLEWQPGAAADGVVEALLPARRLLDVARSLGRCEDVLIGWDPAAGGGLIGFEGGPTRTALRLLDGRLPTYKSLFDMAGAAVAEVEREGLAEAVRRVAVVAEANSPVRLDFSPDGSVMLRAGYGDDVAVQRLPATLTGADEMPVAFNPGYLLDALTSFESPRVRLELLGAGQRALLHAVPDGGAPEMAGELAGETAGEHRHLLMSVKQLV